MGAVGYVGTDPTKVNRAGDTMTGDLILNDGSLAASHAWVLTHAGGGSTQYLEFVQASPVGTWNITHNFGVHPVVKVTDSSGTEVGVTTVDTDFNHLSITFPVPFAGKAVLSA